MQEKVTKKLISSVGQQFCNRVVYNVCAIVNVYNHDEHTHTHTPHIQQSVLA